MGFNMNVEDLMNFEYISVVDVLLRMAFAWFTGYVVSRLYRMYLKKETTHVEMEHTLIFIAVIISVSMMVIGNNLARAFGLVGAVSIIRFKNSVKNTRDMTFVLLSVVIGMACGLGYLLIAISGLVVAGIIMVVNYKMSSKRLSKGLVPTMYSLKMKFKGTFQDRGAVEQILAENATSYHFEAVKTDSKSVSYKYNVSLLSVDILDHITGLLREHPQLDKLKISFAKTE